MKSAGYSGKPLVQKLGFKPGHRIKTRNAPTNYLDMVDPLPEGAVVSARLRSPAWPDEVGVDVWHLFTASRAELEHMIPKCLTEIHQDGMIWVSWPKKSSGVPSEITEDDIRAVALPFGLVDVKVCAVDDVWSGLKLMIRKENRV
jgi:hypothetical protein